MLSHRIIMWIVIIEFISCVLAAEVYYRGIIRKCAYYGRFSTLFVNFYFIHFFAGNGNDITCIWFRCLRVFRKHTRRVHTLEWHCTVDNVILSASLDGQVILWNIETDDVVFTIENCYATSLSFRHASKITTFSTLILII